MGAVRTHGLSAACRPTAPRVASASGRATRPSDLRRDLTRAEPVQKLYEDGRGHHVGTFLELEREMARWSPGQPSPNRMDALVWAIAVNTLRASRSSFSPRSAISSTSRTCTPVMRMWSNFAR